VNYRNQIIYEPKIVHEKVKEMDGWELAITKWEKCLSFQNDNDIRFGEFIYTGEYTKK